MNTTSSSSRSSSLQSDVHYEIDLMDMLVNLWRKKNIIVITMLFFFLLALTYIFLAPQRWTSKTIITLPTAGQLSLYNQIQDKLYSNAPQDKPGIRGLQEMLFTHYSATISSSAENMNNAEPPQLLKVTPLTTDSRFVLKITFTSKNANESREKLYKYLSQINTNTVVFFDEDLRNSLHEKINELKTSLSLQEGIASSKKSKKLELINQALRIAETSGIETPLEQQDLKITPESMFMLGSKALKSMLDHQRTLPLEYDPMYYETLKNLTDLEELKYSLDKLQVFSFIEKPELAEKHDGLRGPIIIIISLIIGFVVGVMNVFIKTSLEYRKKKPS